MHEHLFKNGSDVCPKCGGKLGLKLSRYGAFVGCVNYPTCDYTLKLSNDIPENIPEQNTNNSEKELGENITFRIGKYGPYITDGVKNVPAKNYTAETITLEIAKELLDKKNKKIEPVILGKNPDTDKPIYYYPDGRYGPYLSSNRVTVSVKIQPSLQEAIDLINNKKIFKKGSK